MLDDGDYSDAIEQLPALEQQQQWQVFSRIVALGRQRAVPLLNRALKSSDRELRRFACIYLGDVSGRPAIDLLIDRLKHDQSARVREQAGHALSHMYYKDRDRDDRVYVALRDTLSDLKEHPEVRGQAAEGLGLILGWSDRRRRRFREAQALLLRMLDDPAPEVRFWSIYALGEMRSRQALPKFREMAATDHVKCRNWWLVSEEASDYVARAERREVPDRQLQWDGYIEEE